MKELIRYFIAGVIATVINLSLYFIFTIFIFSPDKAIQLQLANSIAWFLTTVVAYILNKGFVFKSEEKHNVKMILSFFSSRLFTLGIENIMLFVFVTTLGFSNKIIKIIANIVVVLLNYLISKFITFKNVSK